MNNETEIITFQIDVTQIDKEKLYRGKKGTYLNAVLFLKNEDDQYGRHGMIVQETTKEERDQGKKGNILGNAKRLERPERPQQETRSETAMDESQDDIPF